MLARRMMLSSLSSAIVDIKSQPSADWVSGTQRAFVDMKTKGMDGLNDLHILQVDVVLGSDRNRFSSRGMNVAHGLQDAA